MLCRAEEEEFFKASATNSYESFRNKAAESRSMAVRWVISTPYCLLPMVMNMRLITLAFVGCTSDWENGRSCSRASVDRESCLKTRLSWCTWRYFESSCYRQREGWYSCRPTGPFLCPTHEDQCTVWSLLEPLRFHDTIRISFCTYYSNRLVYP